MTAVRTVMPGRRALALAVASGIAGAAALVALTAPMPSGTEHSSIAGLSVPAIVGAGILDGFNPCAFGVLILFATFALGLAARESVTGTASAGMSARAAGRTVLGLGAFFVAGVLVTYFLLGLGLLGAVASFADFGGNHLPSRSQRWSRLRWGSGCSGTCSSRVRRSSSRRRTPCMAGCGPGHGRARRSLYSAAAFSLACAPSRAAARCTWVSLRCSAPPAALGPGWGALPSITSRTSRPWWGCSSSQADPA